MFDPDIRCPVLGVRYNAGELKEAVSYVLSDIESLKGGYICFSNVHTTMTAYKNEAYKRVLNEAELTFPDGHPIAKEQMRKGCREACRIAGPDFMEEVFKRTADGSVSHFFYGSTDETLNALLKRLKEKYPGIKIAGCFSPPFVKELSDEALNKDIDMINEAKADLIWVGLGAPKQEFFMNRAKGRVFGVMLGVGAGFSFHAGTVKRAPELFQRMGLEWLYRLCQDPKRLFKRYLITNTAFLWHTRVLNRRGGRYG